MNEQNEGAPSTPAVTVDSPEFRAALMRVCTEEAVFASTAGTANQYDGFERASTARKELLVHINAWHIDETAQAVAQAVQEVRQIAHSRGYIDGSDAMRERAEKAEQALEHTQDALSEIDAQRDALREQITAQESAMDYDVEYAQAYADAVLYGTGFMIGRRHVPAENVRVIHDPSTQKQAQASALASSEELSTIHKFLLGEGLLNGLDFGDSDPSRPGQRYWWRNHLRAALFGTGGQQQGADPAKVYGLPNKPNLSASSPVMAYAADLTRDQLAVALDAQGALTEVYRNMAMEAARIGDGELPPLPELSFGSIEDAFPEGGKVHGDGQITVNAAWLHQFARNLATRQPAPATVDDVLNEMQPGGALYQPPSTMTEQKIIDIAKSMPMKPWGTGSRREDAIAFAWEVLKVAPVAAAMAQGDALPEPVYLGGDEAFGDVLKGYTSEHIIEARQQGRAAGIAEAANLCGEADKATHPADLARDILALNK